ncbi:S-layer homology domain-containing protein [Paenibacillus lautus]|uniref:S-layer homology domain-containing protein n=1 Tax=Paenibacillus lautus TaxID=1401 RepID=UPI002DB55810|nr:S-layer homology domain-containing protein [Paenibacillus lautus]MEC0204435.1 S-layer homology domain-containing protein [Paenibacillus lautus]
MKRKWIAGLLSGILIGSSFFELALASTPAYAAPSGAMQVFISEIYPDDRSNQQTIEGAGGADLFEYVELYNHSGAPISFNDELNIRYDYNTGMKTLTVTDTVYGNPDRAVIPADSTAVLWVERTSSSITGAAADLTESDFRLYHSVPDHVPVFKLRGQDGLNNTDRGLYITRKGDDADVISGFYYTAEDVGDGKSVHLQPPNGGSDMIPYAREALPSAGIIDPGQLSTPDNRVPEISHTPVASAERTQPLTVSASVYDADRDALEVKLYYKTAVNSPYSMIDMIDRGGNQFDAVIPADQLNGDKLHYYIEAADGLQRSRSGDYETALTGGTAGGDVPRILITEILPNPAGDYRWGSGNQYEYVEVYNNSDQVLDLKDYTLSYLYPGTTAPKHWTIPDHTSLEPYSAAVIWFAKEAVANGKGFTTTADFNLHFNSTLNDSDIIFYDNSKASDFNLPNSLHRGIALSAPGQANSYIVQAWYDPSTPDSPDRLVNDVRNAVVRYAYPDAGTTMRRLDNRMYANPGSIDPGQVPPVAGVDMIAPVLQHEQTAYNMGKGQAYPVSVISDEPLASVEVWIGAATEEPTVFTDKHALTLASQDNGRYVYQGSITLNEIGVYRYIIDAADDSGIRTRVPYNSRGGLLTVNKESTGTELPDPGLSLANGSMLSGKAFFYAYGSRAEDDIEIRFDGNPLPLRKALPGKVQLGMQTRGIDQIYQASASALNPSGETVFFGRILPKYMDGAWSMFDMTPELFVTGTTVSVHTGNENAPYQVKDHDKVFGKNNHDDFEVMNLHLVLPDGSVVKPDKVLNYLGNLGQTTVDYREDTYYGFGDADYGSNPNKPMISDFHFPIPQDKFTARYSELDTDSVEDGIYSINMLMNGQAFQSIDVTVDNTAPEIEGITYGGGQLLADAMQLKGPFTLDVVALDHLTGVTDITAELDGEPITLPYETSSTQLAPGEHILKVTVHDGAGNSADISRTFMIEDEKPLLPGEVSPADFAENVSLNPSLRARLSDPSGDSMDVRFLEGDKYDFAREDGIEGHINVADREPPLALEPDGEQGIGKEDADKIAYPDGEYLITDTDSGFPYHRFEVQLDEAGSQRDTVELHWQGRTLPGRIVTLYAWDYETGKWTGLESATGDETESDITLSAEVEPNRFVRNGKIQAMVQDEVKSANAPFNILWFTDTQYYAESYPEIFDKLGDWITEEYKKGLFSYVIHTGDIVNVADDEKQWAVADRNLKKLDEAGVPYGVLAGNHDVIIDGVDYSYYGKYVGADRLKNNPWYGGEMDNNRNHYDLYSFGGHDFIFLYIGFGLEDTPETIAWANEALKKHADRIAIVGMHAYLESNGTLSNMAQSVFDQVIAPNKNVQLVLSGHYHAANRVVKTVTHPDGSSRQVIEMLADYQGGPNGGNGYLRLLKFDPTSGTLDVDTYSPYLDDYNFFDDAIEDFAEPFAFRDIQKRVATDYFAANVYKDTLIGEQKGVKSGEIASAAWNGRKAGETYYWYMDITDEFGAKRLSQIYRFSTSKKTSPPGGGNNGGGNDGGGNNGNNGNNDGSSNNPGQGKPGGTPPSTGPSKPGTITVGVTISGQRAQAAVSDSDLSTVFESVAADRRGIKTVTIQMDENARSFNGEFVIHFPSAYLNRNHARERIEIVTPQATVKLPSDMLNHLPETGQFTGLVIRPGNRSGLSANRLAGIGNRPVVELLLQIDGKAVEWTGSGTNVRVSLHYDAKAGERSDQLVAWEVDATGSVPAMMNGYYDAGLRAVTFDTDKLGTYAIAYAQVSYRDVEPSSWYADAVHFLSARDIVKGAGGGRFLPQEEISRADFVVMAMNAFGIKPGNTDDDGNFADAGSRYYTPYLSEAKKLGLVQGTGDNRFRPDDSITRQDMVVMLHAMMESAGNELPGGGDGIDRYSDTKDVSGYAREAMDFMLDTGLIKGTGGDKLSPKAFTNRAMAAELMYNYLLKSREAS